MKIMEEKISVIVPVYNVEPYLERCLDSIINNTYRNLEIICVDDGSTDNCGAILDRYAERDDRFVVIHKENGGVSSARNRGLDTATGEFIAFIDSDDWIHPQYFEILLHMQKQRDYDLVNCGFSVQKKPAPYTRFELMELKGRELSLESVFEILEVKTYVWGKLIRRTLLEGERFVENIQCLEDIAFNAHVFASSDGINTLFIPIPLSCYFVREGSLSRIMKIKDSLILSEVLYQYAHSTDNSVAKSVYLQESLKRALSVRYLSTLRRNEQETQANSSKMISISVSELCCMSTISLKKKLLFCMFSYLPITYRLFRIIDDPTLLQMEKNLKAQNKRET